MNPVFAKTLEAYGEMFSASLSRFHMSTGSQELLPVIQRCVFRIAEVYRYREQLRPVIQQESAHICDAYQLSLSLGPEDGLVRNQLAVQENRRKNTLEEVGADSTTLRCKFH